MVAAGAMCEKRNTLALVCIILRCHPCVLLRVFLPWRLGGRDAARGIAMEGGLIELPGVAAPHGPVQVVLDLAARVWVHEEHRLGKSIQHRPPEYM